LQFPAELTAEINTLQAITGRKLSPCGKLAVIRQRIYVTLTGNRINRDGISIIETLLWRVCSFNFMGLAATEPAC
jgi:hypothetical protein